jgi:hypothetical protein
VATRVPDEDSLRRRDIRRCRQSAIVQCGNIPDRRHGARISSHQPSCAIAGASPGGRRRSAFTGGSAMRVQGIGVEERMRSVRGPRGAGGAALLRSKPHITQHRHTFLEPPFDRLPWNESNLPPERVEVAELHDARELPTVPTRRRSPLIAMRRTTGEDKEADRYDTGEHWYGSLHLSHPICVLEGGCDPATLGATRAPGKWRQSMGGSCGTCVQESTSRMLPRIDGRQGPGSAAARQSKSPTGFDSPISEPTS